MDFCLIGLSYKTAPVEIREQRLVGETLGKESVAAGGIAMLIGALLVFLFMVIYYRASGVIADIALVLNVVLILAVRVAHKRCRHADPEQ